MESLTSPPPPLRHLDRPIFLVGCGKSGTSVLGALLSCHPDVGPEFQSEENVGALPQDRLNALLRDELFGTLAAKMEQKAAWDRYLPIHSVPLRIGKELTLLRNPLSNSGKSRLVAALTTEFTQQRFFNKAPFNTFRIHVLRSLFPDAKLIAIHRDGRDVIASWGRKQNRWSRFGGPAKAIPIFAGKWNEAVDHIERYRRELDVKVVRYEELIDNPQRIVAALLEFCELDYDNELYDNLQLGNRVSLWQERIPASCHELVESLTQRNRKRVSTAA